MLPVKGDEISLVCLLQAALPSCRPSGWQPAPQSTVSGPAFAVAARLLQVRCYRRSTLAQGAGKQHRRLSPMGAPVTFTSTVQNRAVSRGFHIFIPKDEVKGNSMELPSVAFRATLLPSRCYRAWLLVPQFSHLQGESHRVLSKLSYNVQFSKVMNSSCHRGQSIL